MAAALASRFWRLGCPKIFHEVAAHFIVFTRMAAELGKSAARSVFSSVIAALESNPTMSDGAELFHASHNNIGAAPGPIDIGQWSNVWELLSNQQDRSSDPGSLNLRATAMLIGSRHTPTAATLRNSMYSPSGSTEDVASFSITPHGDLNSSNNWYGVAANQGSASINVVGLDPLLTPTIERLDFRGDGFAVDASGWKVRLDYGVGITDWRGVTRMALT